MPKQYPKQQRDRAVRMVMDHLDEYVSPYPACKAIAPKVGIGVESLRRWVNQALFHTGDQPGTTSAERSRIRELERETRDLREANEICRRPRFLRAGTRPPTPMIIGFIDVQRRCGHRIALVCKVLGMLGVVFSDRAYRKAKTRPAAQRTVADAVVVDALLGTRRPDPSPAGCRASGSMAAGRSPAGCAARAWTCPTSRSIG